jgi:hypothetical protein
MLFLVIFLFLWKQKHQEKFSLNSYLIFGLVIAFTPLFHGVIFLLVCLSLPLLFFIDKQKKYFIVACVIFTLVAMPSIIYLKSTVESNQNPMLKFLPGYLTAYTFTWFNFFRYWFLNLGLLTLLAPLGFFLVPKRARLLFLFAIPSFLIGNLFSFSPDVATNHKFFNFSIIIFNLYAARVVTKLIDLRYFWVMILIFFLTISGVIDLFPVINDTYFGIPDPSHKNDIEWIRKNTRPTDVFANSYYLFHPASLAGRKIALGWPYFSWSAGYDTEKRVKHLEKLYLSADKKTACKEIKALGVDYVSLNLNIRDVNLKFDDNFWRDNFPLTYDNSTKSGFLIFEAQKTCTGSGL